MLLNILALAATMGVAYMSAVQGAYRAAQTLVACVLAGVLAFGLCGPLAALGPSDNPQSIWYYAADAFFLWVVFTVAFMVLRMAGSKFLPNQPAFPYYINFPAGGILGFATGYLTAGVCLVLVQMLPVAPDFMGYEPFQFVPAASETQQDAVRPGEPLWLSWDRGALGFFGYLSSRPFGADDSSVFRRYGDVYPPEELRPAGYNGAVDVDDVLYYHWYRRFLAAHWRGYLYVTGPLPRPPRAAGEGVGLILEAERGAALNGLEMRVLGVTRTDTIEDFPQVRPPADGDFLIVTLSLRPVKLPQTIDSASILLVTSLGEKLPKPPLIYGQTKAGKESGEVALRPNAPKTEAHGLRFAPAQGAKPGRFLAESVTFDFVAARELAVNTFIFVIPKSKGLDALRILFEPAAAAKPDTATPAKPEKGRPAPAKPAETKAPARAP